MCGPFGVAYADAPFPKGGIMPAKPRPTDWKPMSGSHLHLGHLGRFCCYFPAAQFVYY